MRRILVVAVSLAVLGGCGHAQYDWGSYEDSIARMYGDKNFSPNSEIDILQREIDKSAAKGKVVPPGKHAHLGYLYYSIGDGSNAAKNFAAEKALYPESAVFVDGLMGRMK